MNLENPILKNIQRGINLLWMFSLVCASVHCNVKTAFVIFSHQGQILQPNLVFRLDLIPYYYNSQWNTLPVLPRGLFFSFTKQQLWCLDRMILPTSWWHFLCWSHHVSMARPPLHLLSSLQLAAALLLNVASCTSVRLILFFISSHRLTRQVSASYIFHGRKATITSKPPSRLPPKKAQRSMSSPRNLRNTRKSEFYYKNHLQVLNKCGSQTCLFIWGGRSHSWLAGRTVEKKMSPATTALRLELLDWQMGSRVGIHKTQTEIIAAAVAALPSHWVLLLDTSCTGFIGWGGLVFPPYQCCCIGLALFCWQLLEGSISTFPATLQRDIGKTLFRLQHKHRDKQPQPLVSVLMSTYGIHIYIYICFFVCLFFLVEAII